MKIIKVKTSDAKNREVAKPLEEASRSFLSATNQLTVFNNQSKMVTDVEAVDEIEKYIKDLENNLQIFNKNLSRAKGTLRDLKKWLSSK